MSCNNYKKSTLVATSYGQTIALNDTIAFLTSNRITGNAITISADNKTINLNRSGLYRVSLSATATGSADATAVSLQINRDGVALTDGIASFTPATAEGNAESMSVSTIIEVNETYNNMGKSAIPITITNTGSETIYTFIILAIDKIA